MKRCALPCWHVQLRHICVMSQNGAVPLRFEFCSRRKFIQSPYYRSAWLILKQWMRDSLIVIKNLFHKMLRIIEPVFDRIWDLAVAIPFTAMKQPSKAERLKGLSSTGPYWTISDCCWILSENLFQLLKVSKWPVTAARQMGHASKHVLIKMDEQCIISLKQTEFSSSMVLLYHPCCRTPTFGTDSFRDMHFAFLTRACSFSPLNLFSFLKEFPSWRFFRQKWFLFSRFRLNLSACSS